MVYQGKQDDTQDDGDQHIRMHPRDGNSKSGTRSRGMFRVRDHHGENGQPDGRRIANETSEQGGMWDDGEHKSPEQSDDVTADDIPRVGREGLGHRKHDEGRSSEGGNDDRILQSQEKENHENGQRGKEALENVVLPVKPEFIDHFANGSFHEHSRMPSKALSIITGDEMSKQFVQTIPLSVSDPA
jgi:hypothetical protein